MCVIMCTNYVNYICGRMYIGNTDTMVENITLGVRDIRSIIGWHVR